MAAKRKLSLSGSDQPNEIPQTPKRTRVDEPMQYYTEAEEQAAQTLWDFLQRHHDFRLPTPAASKTDLLGLTYLKLITSSPKPSATSLFVITQLPVNNLSIHFDCQPSDPAKLFDYVWQALISTPKNRNYDIPIRVLSLSWDSRMHESRSAMEGVMFQIRGEVKDKLEKKGYDLARWPTLTSAVNEMEIVGCFKVDMEVRDAKSFRLVSDMMETIIWGKISRRHMLKKGASGIEMQDVQTSCEVFEELHHLFTRLLVV
jgi:hypothetical protein